MCLLDAAWYAMSSESVLHHGATCAFNVIGTGETKRGRCIENRLKSINELMSIENHR